MESVHVPPNRERIRAHCLFNTSRLRILDKLDSIIDAIFDRDPDNLHVFLLTVSKKATKGLYKGGKLAVFMATGYFEISGASYLLFNSFIPPQVDKDALVRHGKVQSGPACFKRRDQNTDFGVGAKLFNILMSFRRCYPPSKLS